MREDEHKKLHRLNVCLEGKIEKLNKITGLRLVIATPRLVITTLLILKTKFIER